MTTDTTPLEPIEPRTALELYLEHKSTSCSKETVQNHRYRLKAFVRWCQEQGIDNMNILSGRDLQRYRLWRKDEGDLAEVTLSMNMSTLRVMLKWAASIEAVPSDLHDKILVERPRSDKQRREETLDEDSAEEILTYLAKFEYASQEHAIFALLWQTGMRLGGAHSIDLTDIDLTDEWIELQHRPNEGTTLKNGKSGERPISITTDLAQVLEDYIETARPKITDEFGRDPLFTTENGRMTKSSIRRVIYKVTSPCYRGEDCPGHDPDSNKCPEGVSPHSIRRGSITHFLANDIPPEIVGDRMNVSRKVLSAHYDKRSEKVKLEQRRKYLDNI